MVSSKIFLFSIVFKCIAMIIGVLGNITVIIYALYVSKEKTATSYLVGNLALADLLVCLTFYPIWITELTKTTLNIDSDQDLFCKLSRPTSWALLFASLATLFAITFDRYLYIAKPLKYPLIVTKRKVFRIIGGIWLTSCSLFIVYCIYYKKWDERIRSICIVPDYLLHSLQICFKYTPIALIFMLNFKILLIAKKQRKRILAERKLQALGKPNRRLLDVSRLFQALKVVKTFFTVFAVNFLLPCTYTNRKCNV